MKKCRNDEGQYQEHEWIAESCDSYGQVTFRCYECDQDKTERVGHEDYGDGIRFRGSLWDAREHIEPPSVGFEMFADSCPTTNVTHLIEEGHDLSDICVVEIGYQASVWVYRGDAE